MIKLNYHFEEVFFNTLRPEHKNKFIIYLLNTELKGSPSIQASIEILFLARSAGLWSKPALYNNLQKLYIGIKALQKNCPPESIECFLQALLSQNPEKIASASQNLIISARSTFFSFFKNNPKKQITQILQDYFLIDFPQIKPEEHRPNSSRNGL